MIDVPDPGQASVDDLLRARLERDTRRVLIYDDDPTGTQAASDAPVILDPTADAVCEWLEKRTGSTYLLTDTRALERADAAELVRSLHDAVEAAATSTNAVAHILRGDSTLRGHVFAEIDSISTDDSVTLFAPAFPDGGRITLQATQWLDHGGSRTPVAETEYARDTAFGYRSLRLSDWVHEVGGDRPVVIVPIDRIRDAGPEAVADALLAAPPGAVVIPEAETTSDVAVAVAGALDAEAAGRPLVIRSASTFAALRAGFVMRLVQPQGPAPAGVLIVCGSHTDASSRQIARLSREGMPTIEVGLDDLESPSAQAEVVSRVKRALGYGGWALLATGRSQDPAVMDARDGRRLAESLAGIVAALVPCVGAIIAKGGNTSAVLARSGLGADRALVVGQLEPGVALWAVSTRTGRTISYVVVPGNVGDDETLLRICRMFGQSQGSIPTPTLPS